MFRKILAANWKMNKSLAEAEQFIDRLLSELPELKKPESNTVETVIFPTFVHLVPLVLKGKETAISFGAQDCYTVAEGAFTGEVSVTQIKDVGAKAVLIGHSERRHKFGEDNALVAEKFKAVIKGGLTAFLCVGESLEERKEGLSYSVVEDQLALPLFNAEQVNSSNLVIAYEPVWAIGTGDNAEPHDVDKMADFIRDWLANHFGETFSSEIPILYGGSVRPGILADYLRSGKVQGALVGGASLDAMAFVKLYKEML